MNYVVDTSVLLSDPKAIQKLSHCYLIIPVVVLKELENKRNHPELGYVARSVLRTLEECRLQTGTLQEPTFFEEGGCVRVELNHSDEAGLPEHLKDGSNDSRILAVALNLSKEKSVRLLTKDLPLRLHAASVGLIAEDYDFDAVKAVKQPELLTVNQELMETLYGKGFVASPIEYLANTPVIVTTEDNQSALAYGNNETLRLVKTFRPYGLTPKNAMQTFALDALNNDNIGIVSIGGLAGSGKTVMALAVGLEAVQKRRYNRVVVFRPVYSVGGQDLGFLPGTAEEKMAPWSDAVYDAMEAFMRPNEIESAKRQRQIEVLPLTHIRGRTLSNSFIIIDEAQNLDLMVLVTAMSRLGENSKIVLTHDVNQRDNLRVGKHDGVAQVIAKLSGNELFAHVSLHRSERSKVAQLVAESFDL